MIKIIDNLNSLTGWSGTNATVYGLNDHLQYVAGFNNTQSIIFNFAQQDGYVEKTYSGGVDVSDYDELVFHVFSTQKRKDTYNYWTDFLYKIDLGSGKEYYMPAYSSFTHVVISISDIDTIDRLRITSLHDDDDYIVMSYMVAAKDQIPYDVFFGVKEAIEYFRDQEFADGVSIGATVSGTAGDKSITFSTEVNFLDRYYSIKIDDGVNSEIHNIESKAGSVFTFGELFDGLELLNDYTDANVYVYLPVRFGNMEREIIIPSISVWGFGNTFINRTGELNTILDTWKTDETVQERKDGKFIAFNLLIDCESDKTELKEYLCKYTRQMLGAEKVYVNGRKMDIMITGDSIEVEPTESFDIIPKVQYPCSVELKEELFNRSTLVKTTTVDLDVNITEEE